MKLIRCTLAAIAFAAGAIWSLLFGSRKREDGRNLEWTKPTYADPFAGGVASDPVVELEEGVGIVPWRAVPAAERHGWQVVGEAFGREGWALVRKPDAPKQSNDSGKSGRTAQSQAKTSDHTADASEAPGGAPGRYFGSAKFHLPEPYHADWTGAWNAEDFEAWARMVGDPVDPSPAEQRERFNAIAGAPRPDAVTIKSALDRIAYHWDATDHWDGAVSTLLTECGTIIDSLGAHLLAMELERDELAATLRKVAEQAKPIDDTDLAELVQGARILAQGWKDQRTGSPADIVGRLIGALNDQARKVAGLADDVRAAEQAHDALLPQLEALQPAMGDTDAAADAYTAITAWVQSATDIGTREWIKLCSRLRWDLLEARKPRTYTEDQRGQACTALRRIALAGEVSEGFAGTRTDAERYGRTIDVVAEALGLERAK